MGYDQILLLDNLIAVKKQVYIKGAGPPMFVAASTERLLDSQTGRQQCGCLQKSFNHEYGIQKSRLTVGATNRFGFINGGCGQNLELREIVQCLPGPLEVGKAVAEIGAEGEKRGGWLMVTIHS